jgi:hypothetical protein
MAITVCLHVKCSPDRFEQQLMIERFCKELDRALSHRLNLDAGISVSEFLTASDFWLARHPPATRRE